MAKCWYQHGNPLPSHIKVAAGTLNEVLRAAEDFVKVDKWAVPLHFGIDVGREDSSYGIFSVAKGPYSATRYLGSVEPGQRFTHPEFLGELTIQSLENGSLRIVREDKTETVLEVPRLDCVDVNKRLRSPWKDYVTFPQNYPVNFQLGS